MGNTREPVRAPMAGTVVEGVEQGDDVVPGTTLVVLEAMKMEHPVRSQVAGRVSHVEVAPGDSVEAGRALLSVAATSVGDGTQGNRRIDRLPMDRPRWASPARGRPRSRSSSDAGLCWPTLLVPTRWHVGTRGG